MVYSKVKKKKLFCTDRLKHHDKCTKYSKRDTEIIPSAQNLELYGINKACIRHISEAFMHISLSECWKAEVKSHLNTLYHFSNSSDTKCVWNEENNKTKFKICVLNAYYTAFL